MSETGQVWAVIMAGGSGTRFWPISTGARPKQLTRLLGPQTMIQLTVGRLAPFVPPERILVVTTEAIAAETRAQLPQVPADHIIAEPVGRDTAPCVGLAAEIVHRLDPSATMVLLPADQLIEPARRFQEVLQAGVTAAADGALVTYGIQPRYPATGYGYIKLGDERLVVDGITVNHVDRFVEKPDATTAERYLDEGGYRWNSGIFTWRVDVVRGALSEHCPDLSQALQPLGANFGTDAFAEELARVYPGLQKISIDYALMERAEAIDVVTADFDWDDVGSWDALYDHLSADEAGNRVEGEAILQNCSGCLVVNDDGPLLTGINLQDLTLVARGGAVLAMPRGAGQGVKEMVGRLREAGREDVL